MSDAPLSDTPVGNYVDTRWREAMRAQRETVDYLRDLYPEMAEYLSETGARHLRDALAQAESGLRYLHLAGRHVLGEDGYDEYLKAQATRRMQD